MAKNETGRRVVLPCDKHVTGSTSMFSKVLLRNVAMRVALGKKT